jgi:hypothetical protein
MMPDKRPLFWSKQGGLREVKDCFLHLFSKSVVTCGLHLYSAFSIELDME